MSELREQRWSVLSERGCEASSVNYDEAADLVRRLRADKIHGLCIISDEAARRLTPHHHNNNGTGATARAATEITPAVPPPAKKRAAPQKRETLLKRKI